MGLGQQKAMKWVMLLVVATVPVNIISEAEEYNAYLLEDGVISWFQTLLKLNLP